MHYSISPAFSSCLLYPPAPPLLASSPPTCTLPSPPPSLQPLVQSPLAPPTPINPGPRPLHRPLSEVYNMSRRNILSNRFLPFEDVDPDLLENHLLHCCCQQWIFRAPLVPSPRLFPRDLPLKPVLKTSYGPSNAGGLYPHIQT